MDLGEAGVLNFGSNIAYAPFEFVDPSQSEPVGFDIDVGKALAANLGLEARFTDNPSFDALIPALEDGQYDAVISALVITPEREKAVDFTKGYVNSSQALIVGKGSKIKSIADLSSNDVVGEQENTTGSTYAEEHLKGKVADIRTYNGASEIFQDLVLGRIQANITALGAGSYAVQQEYGEELEVVQTLETDEEVGIAVRKGNASLVKALDRGIAKLEAHGTIAKLERKWFGVES